MKIAGGVLSEIDSAGSRELTFSYETAFRLDGQGSIYERFARRIIASSLPSCLDQPAASLHKDNFAWKPKNGEYA